MKKRILFVNPNRYLYPPVIPVGLEYLLHALRMKSFDVDLLDLCFSDEPLHDLGQRIAHLRPDALCVTIRNIDSALFGNNEYFLPEIRRQIMHIKSLTPVPVIIGGAGLLADPIGILTFLNADIAVVGPGETTLPRLLQDDTLLKAKGKVLRGERPDSLSPPRAAALSYVPYLQNNGIPGFETHRGCTSSCGYCIEANTPVTFRDPADVVSELRGLAEQGFDHLHLCDSEFNEDLDYSIDVLHAILRERLSIRWALYMKPGNYNRKLFNLLRESGAYLITLSVDTFHKCPEYWTDIESMVFLARKSGIRISIDLLTGFPYENEDTLKETLDFFRRIEPDETVVNVFLRIYRNTKIREIIDGDPTLRKFLTGTEAENDSYLAPCFYNHVPVGHLRELVSGERAFRIAGEEKSVNYQKAS